MLNFREHTANFSQDKPQSLCQPRHWKIAHWIMSVWADIVENQTRSSFPSISNVFSLIYVAALIYFKILSLPDMSLFAWFERKIKRTQRIIISGKTYLLSIYYVPVSVLRYRKRRNSQPNIWQIGSCLKEPLRKQTSEEIIALQCNKVLMGRGYAPGAEVLQLAFHHTANKWFGDIIQHGGYPMALPLRDQTFQKFPLKDTAQHFTEHM